MKKTVIATMLVLSAIAAQAQVSLSGKIGQYIDSQDVGGAKTTTISTDTTSNVTITATEKLSNGLSARVTADTSVAGNTVTGTGTVLGDRQRTVALSHAMGTVSLGRGVHTQFAAISDNDAFSTLYGSVAGDIHNLNGLRLDNAVFVTGNVGPATVSFNQSQDAGRATSASIAGSYRGVNAVVAQHSLSGNKSTVVGLNTRIVNMSVFYSHSQEDGAVAQRGDLIGVSQTFGPMTVKASYGQTDNGTSATAVGADYALSKRTSVGGALRVVNTAAVDTKQLGVGIVHNF